MNVECLDLCDFNCRSKNTHFEKKNKKSHTQTKLNQFTVNVISKMFYFISLTLNATLLTNINKMFENCNDSVLHRYNNGCNGKNVKIIFEESMQSILGRTYLISAI